MPISLMLPANRIPDGIIVFKLTGSTPYILKKKLEVYNKSKTRIWNDTGSDYYLISYKNGHINQVPQTKVFRLDFENLADASNFIENMINETEGD